MSTRSKAEHAAIVQAQATARATTHRNRRRYQLGAWAGALVLIAALVTVGLLTSRPDASATQRTAPAFTLPTTTGTSVSLSDYRGGPVILYFNEGAGCAACTMQLAAIEKDPGFAAAGISVLPIVMNTREQIQPDLDQYGATTPVLLDDGTVSQAYDTLGKGMHEGLPGHSFVLISPDGTQLWYGEYPSMWLEPAKLLDKVTALLAA
ncbi:peroxiredoxin family protein [Pengzhenrongella phosphoraccumulans]|uniref:peroxiredoxin family protein n=1 Tax=Pengzhenrongella phosphoraccumulans TaxID=3114394 RepID=UPI00388E7B2D